MSKLLLKQTILYSIGEIIPKLIGFILLPVYTHFLSPKDYGILGYTSSIAMLLYVLSSLALNSFVMRNYFELKTEVEKDKLIGNVFIFIGLVNVLLLAISYIIIPFLISTYKVQVPWQPYFKLALLNNFLDVFSIIPLVLYRVRQQAKYFVILNLSRVLLQLALTYYFIVIEKKGLIGNYLGQLYPLILYFVIYWIIMIRQVKLNFNFTQIREGLKFAYPLLPGSLAYLALGFADRIILERYVQIAEIGIYNVAFMLTLSLNIVIQSGYKAIEPEIFKRFGKPGFTSFIKGTQSLFLFIVYCGAMLISLFSQEVFKIMASPSFYKGYLLVPIIMIGVIMTGQNVIFGGILTAEKNTRILGVSTIIGAVINILFNLLLVPYFGVYAAAISVAVSFAVMNYLLYLKMDFVEKEIKSEFYALFLFILITALLFYVFNIQFSLIMFFLKLLIFIVFVIILGFVFKLNFKSLASLLKNIE